MQNDSNGTTPGLRCGGVVWLVAVLVLGGVAGCKSLRPRNVEYLPGQFVLKCCTQLFAVLLDLFQATVRR